VFERHYRAIYNQIEPTGALKNKTFRAMATLSHFRQNAGGNMLLDNIPLNG
jgi:hypothetical protein